MNRLEYLRQKAREMMPPNEDDATESENELSMPETETKFANAPRFTVKKTSKSAVKGLVSTEKTISNDKELVIEPFKNESEPVTQKEPEPSIGNGIENPELPDSQKPVKAVCAEILPTVSPTSKMALETDLLASSKLCGSMASALHSHATSILDLEDQRPVMDRTEQAVKLALSIAALVKTQVEINRSIKED